MRKLWLLVLGGMLIGSLSALADPVTGEVQGPDAYNPGCYLIHLPSDAKIAVRDVVRIERKGTLVTEASISQVQVDQIAIRPKDAKAVVQPGDTVVYVGPPAPTAMTLRPRVIQPGLHLTINPATTFTDDNGNWAANCLVSNDGDEIAWLHLGATFTTSTGQTQNLIDRWLDIQPGETTTVTFNSGFKSPFGARNDVSEHNGQSMQSNWKVQSGQVEGITSISCEVHPKFGSKGKPRS